MSTSSSSSGHSRYASTSSTSSLGSFSDTHQHSLYQESPNHQDSYPQAQSRRHDANFASTNGFDFRTHDNMGHHDRLSSQYQHSSSRQDMQLIRNENALLQQRILVLEAEKSTLQNNFNSLLSSMSNPPPALPSVPRHRPSPTPSSSTVPDILPAPPLVVYSENDFPEATFWQQKLWNRKVKNDIGRDSTPENPVATKNSLLFITTEDGTYPTPERITEARSICASFYFGLKKSGSLPDTWTQVTLADKQSFRANIESEIPDLRFCGGHWKADRLASITYSSWCGTHNPKRNRVKTEPNSDIEMDAVESDLEDPAEETGSKRKGAPSHPPPAAKKLKSKVSSSTSTASVPDRKGKAAQGQRPKNPLFGRTPAPSFSPAPDSALPPTPTPAPAPPDSTLALTPTPAPTPSPAPDSTLAPTLTLASTSTAPDSTLAPAPTPAPTLNAPDSTLAPALAPAPTSTAPDSTLALTLLPAPVSMPGAPSFAPVAPAPDSTLAPTPTPAPASTAAPSVVLTTESTLAPTLMPAPASIVRVPDSTLAPTPMRTPASTTAPSSTPSPPVSTATEKKTRAWNPLGTSTTAKGMCAYDYKKRNPDAGKAHFDIYFASLPSDKKKFWRDEEKQAKTAKAAATSTAHTQATSAS